MSGPLAPAVLEELERRLALVSRPARPAQLAERLLQLAVELRAHSQPPRDLFLIAAATALAGAAACCDRDAAERRDRLCAEHGVVEPAAWELAPDYLNDAEAATWAAGRETIMLSDGHTLVRRNRAVGRAIRQKP